MKFRTTNEAKKKNKVSKRIIGIEVLRMFLSFGIVFLHYYSSKNKYLLKIKSNQFQVSTFFFISFYFLYPTISQTNSFKLKLRLERLLIPYIIYPVIVWIINNIMFLLIKFNRFHRLLTLRELIMNLIVGKGIFGIGVLWFHFNLLIFTLLFFIFAYFLKNYFLSVFQIIALYSYIIQYSKINYNFFKQYKINISMPVGNLVETFPIAILAFSSASINFFQRLLTDRKKFVFLSSFFLYLLFNYNIFSPLKGYSSKGIYKNVIASLLFNIFFLTQFELLNSKILQFIKQMTKYTQGIYCHFVILFLAYFL